MTTPTQTILVVDDQPENLMVIGEILKPHYRVRVATSGERAVEVARRAPTPDLALLDIMMPGMDGYALLARLREDESLTDMPVIFVTGRGGSDDERRGLEAGAVDYITKPIEPATVLARVRTHLELKDARDRLRNQNALLEATVAARVAELQVSQQQLRALAARQIVLKEEERKHIAQEIHDELGQRLTVLRMDIAMLPRAVRDDPTGLLPQRVQELKASLDGIVAVVRNIAASLRPATLELGLEAAAEGLVEEFGAHSGIACTLDNRLPSGFVLDDARATAAYRILQESLTNVARHAGANRVAIALASSDGVLQVQVHDNGRGIDPAPRVRNPSLGLSGMCERAAILGGSVTIVSPPGEGTTVTARIPLLDDGSAATDQAAVNPGAA